jgi:hypothetical protein
LFMQKHEEQRLCFWQQKNDKYGSTFLYYRLWCAETRQPTTSCPSIVVIDHSYTIK